MRKRKLFPENRLPLSNPQLLQRHVKCQIITIKSTAAKATLEVPNYQTRISALRFMQRCVLQKTFQRPFLQKIFRDKIGRNMGGQKIGGLVMGGRNMGGRKMRGRNMRGRNMGGRNMRGRNMGDGNKGGWNRGEHRAEEGGEGDHCLDQAHEGCLILSGRLTRKESQDSICFLSFHLVPATPFYFFPP